MKSQALPRHRLVILSLVLFVGCTSTGSPSAPISSGSGVLADSVTPSQRFLSGPCPVTQPVPSTRVPRAVVNAIEPGRSTPLGTHDFDYWYGNDALWVELPPGSEVVRPATEELSEKFPWVRLVRGHLGLEGRRLDGPAPPAAGTASNGYGLVGFQASGVKFPTPGCWEIIGTVAGQELSFTVQVRRQMS